jgi:tetratricopeptide (TPR) repeat protein
LCSHHHIGYKLLKHDANVAFELVKEAFTWAPNDPFLWSQRAIIEAVRGKYSNAAALLWEARRRFPENSQIRSKLAHLMEKQRRYKIAEALYRQAMEDFPQNVVCRNGLAVVLLKKKQEKEAISILKETHIAFPNNEVAEGLLKKIVGGEEISEEDEKIIELEAAKPGDKDFLEDENFDLHLPDQAVETQPLSDQKEKELIEKAVERNGASVVRQKEPEEYGKSFFPDVIRSEINEIEAEIGEITLDLRESRRIDGGERGHHKDRIFKTVDKVLEKAPGNIPALLVKGQWLADYDTDETEYFFSQQSKSHPNTLGFRLLDLRAKSLKGKAIDSTLWNDLKRDFPGRSTIISLEQILCSLNGSKDIDKKPLEGLERLRKRLLKDLRHLPTALQKNEEWVRQAIQHRLFEGLDIKDSLSPGSLGTVNKNLKKKTKELVLRDAVDQCIFAAV